MLTFPVTISNLFRFQPNTACLQWTSNPPSKKFNFTLLSENSTTLYKKEVEIGTSIVQPKTVYTVIISAMAEGGQSTISNLQSGTGYKVVIDSLNENGQRIGSATATIPSISTVREIALMLYMQLFPLLYFIVPKGDCYFPPKKYSLVSRQAYHKMHSIVITCSGIRLICIITALPCPYIHCSLIPISVQYLLLMYNKVTVFRLPQNFLL